MKKTAIVLLLGMFFAVSALAGAEERDLSTPSSRLVGHWSTDEGTHYYFGAVGGADKTGALIVVGSNETVGRESYRVLSERPDGEELTIQTISAPIKMDRRMEKILCGDDSIEKITVEVQGFQATRAHRLCVSGVEKYDPPILDEWIETKLWYEDELTEPE